MQDITQNLASTVIALTISISFIAAAPTAAQTASSAPSTLDVASVRRSIAEQRALIAAHPNDPANYVNLAYTFMDAGMGDQARRAVADAVRVAPRSAFAFSAQGWILHHNNIGVDYGKGLDYDGSIRAYQKSIELDPRNMDTRQSLANILEFNRDGLRYGPGAQLPLAIEAYRYVKRQKPAVDLDLENNLAIDLFYSGRYDEAAAELESLPYSTERGGVILASIAASKGSSTAVEISNQIGGDEQNRKNALVFAAEGLWKIRKYREAADLLTASLPDISAKTTASKIQIFRTLKPYVPEDLPASDPRRPVQKMMEAIFTGTLSESLFADNFSRYPYTTDAEWRAALRQQEAYSGVLYRLMKNAELPQAVVADIVLNNMNILSVPSNGPGFPIHVKVMGAPIINLFVLPEDGQFKIVATDRDDAQIGAAVLHLLSGKTVTVTKRKKSYSRQPHSLHNILYSSRYFLKS
jgi:cytochrome c-type biogenesis protein CcmH/NrfG